MSFQVILFDEYQMGAEAEEIGHNINQAFDQETVKEWTIQHSFLKCKLRKGTIKMRKITSVLSSDFVLRMFHMGAEAVETGHNINQAFDQEMVKECTTQESFRKKFDNRALKMIGLQMSCNW